MTPQAFYEREFARYRVEFAAGNPVALHEAVLLAIWSAQPVPDWAVPEVETIMKMHADGRFERKQGVAAPLAVEDRHRLAATLYQTVEWLMTLDEPEWRFHAGAQRKNKTAAFEVAAQIIREAGARTGSADHAHINADAVKNAYYTVRRAVEKGDGARYGLV